MAVGYPWTKQSVDARAGQLVLTLRDTLAGIQRLKAQLDGRTTEDLVALGWTEAEAATLKSTFVDLDKLARIADGTEIQAAQSDFWWHARNVVGPN